jgi:hypothetical protein
MNFVLEDPVMSVQQPSRRHLLGTFFGGLFGWLLGSHASAGAKQADAGRSHVPAGPKPADLLESASLAPETGTVVVWRQAVVRQKPAYETRHVYDDQGRLIMAIDREILF